MSPISVVVDTNVLISALLFGGKPREILRMVIDRDILAVISPALILEFLEVLAKKFLFPHKRLLLVEKKVKKTFRLVYPTEHIEVLHDQPDNRVLEAARAGECRYIVTGDKELLGLESYKTIAITTPKQFLEELLA